MQHSLSDILSIFTKDDGSRRVIPDLSKFGGSSPKSVIITILLLPVISYAIFFNPFVFNKLGLLTSVVAYIISMSVIIFSSFLIVTSKQKKMFKVIEPLWKEYFPEVDFKYVYTTRISPYNNFYNYLKKFKEEKLDDEELYKSLKDAINTMENENKELLNNIKRSYKND